jgi:hypothetical protein
MATLDELLTNLTTAASAHAVKAMEADLLNCLDLFIETAASKPTLAIQTDVPNDAPPFKMNLESARSGGLGAEAPTPSWIAEFQALVAKVRQDTGIARPSGV